MNLETHEDLDAPAEHVWDAITRFDHFEAQARIRGAKVTRTDAGDVPGAGSRWDLAFEFRGKRREIQAVVTEWTPPRRMRVDCAGGGIAGDVVVEVVDVSPDATRLQISVDLTPRNLAGRLLIQSLRFARARLQKRFADKVSAVASGIEGRYRKAG